MLILMYYILSRHKYVYGIWLGLFMNISQFPSYSLCIRLQKRDLSLKLLWKISQIKMQDKWEYDLPNWRRNLER